MQILTVSTRLTLAACSLMLLPGCFSLSLGSKTCTGDHPETKARIMSLETRVNKLEKMLGTPASMETVPVPTQPVSTISQPESVTNGSPNQQGFYGKS